MVEALKNGIGQIKSMPAEQLGETSGKLGVDLVAGAYSFKALHLVAKGASPVILDKAKKFHSTLKTEQVATEECFNALPAITKIVMEDGDIVAERVAEVIKTDAGLLLKDGKSPAKVAQDLVKDVKIGRGSNFANQTRPQLIKSKASCESLIVEHEKKLAEYISDPVKYDNRGLLKGAPTEEIKQKIIRTRVEELGKQIRKHKFDLDIIKELLKLKG